MYTVIAKITAKSEASIRIKKSLQALLAPTRKEDGCITYILHEAIDDSNLFMVYEVWQSEAAFDKHMNSIHIQEWAENFRPLITSWRMYLLTEIDV